MPTAHPQLRIALLHTHANPGLAADLGTGLPTCGPGATDVEVKALAARFRAGISTDLSRPMPGKNADPGLAGRRSGLV